MKHINIAIFDVCYKFLWTELCTDIILGFWRNQHHMFQTTEKWNVSQKDVYTLYSIFFASKLNAKQKSVRNKITNFHFVPTKSS